MSNNAADKRRFSIYVNGVRKTKRRLTATEAETLFHRWRAGKYYGMHVEIRPHDA